MIIDTFMFNQDFAALEIRLAELYDVVDMFIISESCFTHSGLSKKLHLSENLHLFNKYTDKMTIIVERKRHFTKNARIREMHQRNTISKHLKTLPLSEKDLIVHSDCDEIPKSSILIELSIAKGKCNALLELNNYINYLNMESGTWLRGRVISGNLYKSIQNMRQDIFLFNNYDKRRHKISFIRISDFWTARIFYLWKLPQYCKKPNLQIVRNAGWHFNNLITADQIIQKIESSSHTESNTEAIKAKAIFNYKKGRCVITGHQYYSVPIDDSYPKIVKENLEKWENFIFKTKQNNDFS